MGEGILTMESKHRFSMEQRRDCKVTGVVEVHWRKKEKGCLHACLADE